MNDPFHTSVSEPEAAAKNGWEAKSRATRKRLILAAYHLMAEVGVDAVSVAAVARRANVTRPGAYYHFQNRDELLEAVHSEVDRVLIKTVGGTHVYDDSYTFAAEIAAQDPRILQLRIIKMLDQGPKTDVLIKSRIRAFARLKREGHLQAGIDPEMAAYISTAAIFSSYLGVSSIKQKKKRQQQVKVFGQAYYQFLFHGALKEETYMHWDAMPSYVAVKAGPSAVADVSKMKNARPARSSKTRALLIDATMQLLSEVGEDSVSVAEVAKRAGVTRPGAYYHFKSKEDLLTAVREKLDSELLYTIDRSFTIREPFSDTTDLVPEDQNMINLRIKEMINSLGAGDPLMKYYRALFKWHAKLGHLKPGIDPAMAAALTCGISLLGSALALAESHQPAARKRLAQRFRRTYRQFVFDGMLDADSGREWPRAPK